MADTGFAEYFDAPAAQPGFLRRMISALFASRGAELVADGTEVPRKLAGPEPSDRRARDYLSDLDIEVGF